MADPGKARPGRYAYGGLDRTVHEKARLGVLTSLAAHPAGLSFREIKVLCGLTDGNLSRHLAHLEEEGLVTIEKRFEGKRPLTTCRLTESGRQRYLAYLAELEKILRDAPKARVDTGFPSGRAEPSAS
ncbi:MAG: transcriptional regulator [Pseudomonadota bacterium]